MSMLVGAWAAACQTPKAIPAIVLHRAERAPQNVALDVEGYDITILPTTRIRLIEHPEPVRAALVHTSTEGIFIDRTFYSWDEAGSVQAKTFDRAEASTIALAPVLWVPMMLVSMVMKAKSGSKPQPSREDPWLQWEAPRGWPTVAPKPLFTPWAERRSRLGMFMTADAGWAEDFYTNGLVVGGAIGLRIWDYGEIGGGVKRIPTSSRGDLNTPDELLIFGRGGFNHPFGRAKRYSIPIRIDFGWTPNGTSMQQIAAGFRYRIYDELGVAVFPLSPTRLAPRREDDRWVFLSSIELSYLL